MRILVVEDEKELEELKSNTKVNNNTENNNKNLLNKKTNRDNHNKHNNNNVTEINNNEEENEKSEEIIVRIICDPRDEELQKYFKYTRMKVDGSYTLEFISRFICYKQNFKCEQINKINFYTYDNNSKKKYWSQDDKISDVANFDSKVNKNNKNDQEETKENFYINLYHLNLNFYINN